MSLLKGAGAWTLEPASLQHWPSWASLEGLLFGKKRLANDGVIQPVGVGLEARESKHDDISGGPD